MQKLKVPVHVIGMPQYFDLTRLKGTAMSVGHMVTFSGAHCACRVRWLECLLARIKHDKTTIVYLVIKVLTD